VLKLSYSNLAPLLMALGLAYDSPAARMMASCDERHHNGGSLCDIGRTFRLAAGPVQPLRLVVKPPYVLFAIIAAPAYG